MIKEKPGLRPTNTLYVGFSFHFIHHISALFKESKEGSRCPLQGSSGYLGGSQDRLGCFSS